MSRLETGVKLACLALPLAITFAATALARPPTDHPLDPFISSWFKGLKHPNLNFYGGYCCDEADGRVLADDEWRTTAEGYEVQVNGDWKSVPPDAILSQTDNPTGGAVVFYYRNQILCFVRPNES